MQVFSCTFCEISKSSFIEHLSWLLFVVESCSIILSSVKLSTLVFCSIILLVEKFWKAVCCKVQQRREFNIHALKNCKKALLESAQLLRMGAYLRGGGRGRSLPVGSVTYGGGRRGYFLRMFGSIHFTWW